MRAYSGVVRVRLLRHCGALGEPMSEPQFTIEYITDPAEIARSRAQDERAKRNMDWLAAHWGDLLPQARGKILAVAGQEAHLADTPEEAWAWARTAHPEDDGAFVSYVPTHQGPRIYRKSLVSGCRATTA